MISRELGPRGPGAQRAPRSTASVGLHCMLNTTKRRQSDSITLEAHVDRVAPVSNEACISGACEPRPRPESFMASGMNDCVKRGC